MCSHNHENQILSSLNVVNEFCSAVVKIVVSIAEFKLILDPASCSCRLALSDSVDLFPPFVIIEQQLALSGVWFGGFDAD